MQHYIEQSMLYGYHQLVTQLGGDPDALLRQHHIGLSHHTANPLDLTDLTFGQHVPFQSSVHLIEATANALACDDFGRRLAQVQGIQFLGPLAVLARNQPNLLKALQSLSHYLRVFSSAILFDVKQYNQTTRVTCSYPNIETVGPQFYELALGNIMVVIRFLSQSKVAPSRVYFPHHSVASVANYHKFFNCSLAF
ncbi:MAG: AraC family transcriptional regulator ligand-binding domain-containing protein, partial [Vibrio sp.]